jgi:uncharacterized membrane protein
MTMLNTQFVRDTITTAWTKVHGAKKTFWAGIGVMLLVAIGFGVVAGLLSGLSQGLAALINLISQVANTLLQVGLVYIGITRAKNMPINFRQIFRSFELPIALKVIGVYLLQMLIYIPVVILFAFLPVFLLGNSMGDVFTSGLTISNFLLITWSLLGIIACVYLTLRMIISTGYAVDQGIAPWTAIKLSFAATEGNVLSLLAIVLFQFLVILVSVLTLGIAFIWTLPYVFIIYGTVYKNLGATSETRTNK